MSFRYIGTGPEGEIVRTLRARVQGSPLFRQTQEQSPNLEKKNTTEVILLLSVGPP